MNFLPPNLRFRPENILVVTLYFGENKPNAYSLLYPLAKEIDTIQKNKITVYDSNENEFYEFIPSIIMASCDLPAKQMLLNIIALSGRESCSFCYNTGESVPKPKGKTNIRYTFSENFIERTNSETIQYGITAVKRNGKPVKGIKGRSVMELFEDFDLINSFTIDFMHNISGIVKHMIEIWTGKKTLVTPPHENFKIKSADKRKLLNERLLKLKPYSAITRKPRFLVDLSLFKASELLMCLWLHLPLTINGILDKKVIDNFTKISFASYNLCKKKASSKNLEKSCDMLEEFVREFECIYGKSAVTNNIHLLRHYRKTVVNCGPLWAYSWFGFKSNIGTMKSFVCGPTDSMHQIAEKYLSWKSFPVDKKDLYIDISRLLQPKIIVQ